MGDHRFRLLVVWYKTLVLHLGTFPALHPCHAICWNSWSTKQSAQTTIKLGQAAYCHPASEAIKEYPDSNPSKEADTFHKVNFPPSTRFWKLLSETRTVMFPVVAGMQTNRSAVSEPGFLNSMGNTSPWHRVFVQHEGTYTRRAWEQNSHQVKLQLIIIVTDNKAHDKRVKAMLTPLYRIQKQKKWSICPLATSLKDVTWAERKHQASQQAAKGRRRVGVTQRSCLRQMCPEPGAAHGRDRASSCNCPHPAPQPLEQENPVILNGE